MSKTIFEYKAYGLAAGDTLLSLLDASGNSLGSISDVGALTLPGGVSATGDSTITGALHVTGAVTADSTLAVTGNLSVNTSKFTVNAASGNTLVAGTLGITGVTTGSDSIWGVKTMVNTEGISPSYKMIYGNITIPNTVTEATQYYKAVQGFSTTDTGAHPAETWGGYFLNNVNGTGVQNSAWACVGELAIDGTGNMGIAQGNSFHTAGYFHSWINATKTLLGGIDAPLVGDINMATGRRKADAAIAAVLNGDINQSTAGAGAGFKVYHFNNQCGFDYGLDMDLVGASTAAFAVADIRFSNGLALFASTAAITANVTTTSLPAGSLAFTSNVTGTNHIFYSDGSKWQLLA